MDQSCRGFEHIEQPGPFGAQAIVDIIHLHREVFLEPAERLEHLPRGCQAGPRHRIDLGFAAVPADRQGQAIASTLSVADNYAIAHLHEGRFGPWWFVNRTSVREAARAAVSDADVQGVRSVFQRISLLSGGNAQKLVIAREFSRKPSVMVVHSPSRGLDVRACAAIHRRLLDARDEGVAVLVISEDLDEILSLSDRIGVISGGRLVAEFEAPGDRHAIGRAMVGDV